MDEFLTNNCKTSISFLLCIVKSRIMTNICTLRDINTGHRLGCLREQDLENKLLQALTAKDEINNMSRELQQSCIEHLCKRENVGNRKGDNTTKI